MDRRRYRPICITLILTLLIACAPLSPSSSTTSIPGAVDTVIALTHAVALTQTASFASRTPTSTITPINTPRPSTQTATLTATFILPFLWTHTPTNSPLPPTRTSTLKTLLEWPDWKDGTVVKWASGTGENVGTTKFFNVLENVEVVVSRRNGVKLLGVPNKAASSKIRADHNEHLTLTGYWNINNNHGWSFVKVIAADDEQYWIGGDTGGDTDPQECLEFVP